MDGILALRRQGGPRANVAEGLRLAQIPAGSTDAVAWTINGSRSPETAALHVALGEGYSPRLPCSIHSQITSPMRLEICVFLEQPSQRGAAHIFRKSDRMENIQEGL